MLSYKPCDLVDFSPKFEPCIYVYMKTSGAKAAKRHLHQKWDNNIKWKLSVPSIRYIFENMTFYSVMNNRFNSFKVKLVNLNIKT